MSSVKLEEHEVMVDGRVWKVWKSTEKGGWQVENKDMELHFEPIVYEDIEKTIRIMTEIHYKKSRTTVGGLAQTTGPRSLYPTK